MLSTVCHRRQQSGPLPHFRRGTTSCNALECHLLEKTTPGVFNHAQQEAGLLPFTLHLGLGLTSLTASGPDELTP